MSLNPETRKAIAENQRPGGKPIVLTGYASTTGKVAENHDLGYARAEAVMDRLLKFSGNRHKDGKTIFQTPSPGEYKSPAGTDNKQDEKELAEYRRVDITMFDVHKQKFDAQ